MDLRAELRLREQDLASLKSSRERDVQLAVRAATRGLQGEITQLKAGAESREAICSIEESSIAKGRRKECLLTRRED